MFTFDEFRDAVKTELKKVLNKHEVAIGDDENFGDYGLDSLTGMSLVMNIESFFGIDLGEFDIIDANSIRLFYDQAKKIVEESE